MENKNKKLNNRLKYIIIIIITINNNNNNNTLPVFNSLNTSDKYFSFTF